MKKRCCECHDTIIGKAILLNWGKNRKKGGWKKYLCAGCQLLRERKKTDNAVIVIIK